MPKLVVISKSQTGLSHELGSHWVTIGRAPGNAFQIVDPSVSGQHCEVLARDNEVVVRDMRSTNGTFIKGRLVAEGLLKPGETLQLGEVEMRLEATVPKGRSLSVYSPAEKAAAQTSPAPSSNSNRTTQKVQVLLVDDSMAFLESTGDVFAALANGEWEIHRACGADQALTIVQQTRIDIAVIDLNMPMLDGLQLLAMLHRRHPEVKKVVLTGFATEAQRSRCLEGGAELFLEKPVTTDGMRFVFNVLNDLITWKQREGFAGTLQQVGLNDIIQIECLRRSSRVLEIHAAHLRGEIYIDSGMIVHAVAGDICGEKALHRLLSLDNGQFHLYPYREPAERSVQGSWEWLLMEAARVDDEEKSAKANEKTVFINRPSVESKPGVVEASATAAGSAEKLVPSSRQLPPADLGNEIVVVSTYDGKWQKE